MKYLPALTINAAAVLLIVAYIAERIALAIIAGLLLWSVWLAWRMWQQSGVEPPDDGVTYWTQGERDETARHYVLNQYRVTYGFDQGADLDLWIDDKTPEVQ